MFQYRSRYLEKMILEDLGQKMVFIGGPRQVGKTRLAKELGESPFHHKFQYLNWDAPQNRKAILDHNFNADAKLLIFDEIHKLRKWKLYLKGIFDTKPDDVSIMATGSARLNVYKKGGDSLLGRYHYYRLHPFSLAELNGVSNRFEPFKALHFPREDQKLKKLFARLEKFGGFPEPFFAQDEIKLRHWHNQRVDSIVREDIRDLERISDLSAMMILVNLLPTKVGSLFSLNSLREDFGVAHKTVSHWVSILEQIYYHFRLTPFSTKYTNYLKKEPKLYLWDWSEITNPAFRLENMVASHLLKFVHYLYDYLGYRAELHFVRDKRGGEIDFLVTVDNKPWFAVEVKETEIALAHPLALFSRQLKIPFLYQIVRDTDQDVFKSGVRIMSVSKFLNGLV